MTATSHGEPGCRKREDRVDLLKGWAILGVVFIHMAFASRFGPGVIATVAVLQRVFGWAVVAFFFCGGYLYARSSRRGSVGGYIRKRALRLLTPWVAFSILYKVLLAVMARAHLVAVPVTPGAGLGRQFIEWVRWPGAPQLYFLPALFVIGVLCRCVSVEKWSAWAVMGAALAISAGQGWLGGGAPHGGEVVHCPAYLAAYMMGIFAAHPDYPNLPAWVGALCLAGLGILWPALLYLLAVPLLFELMRAMRGPVAARARWLGANAGAVYVWHTPVIMPALSILLARFIPDNAPLLIPLLMALTIFSSVVVARAVGRIDRCGILAM